MPLDTDLLNEIIEMLKPKPSAGKFLQAYAKYCHALDDVIDEKLTSSEFVTDMAQLGSDLFNSNFWREYNDTYNLYIVDALINNDYADSNLWHGSDINWKREQAKVLSHSANNMLFAVIFIVAGRDALRKVSLRIRESSHNKHLHNNIPS